MVGKPENQFGYNNSVKRLLTILTISGSYEVNPDPTALPFLYDDPIWNMGNPSASNFISLLESMPKEYPASIARVDETLSSSYFLFLTRRD
jgi:hypothetical protein